MTHKLLRLVLLALSVSSNATCIQDDHLFCEYGHEQRREGRDIFHDPDSSRAVVNSEVNTEHLQRYWGMTGQFLSNEPALKPESSDTATGNFCLNQVPQQHLKFHLPTSQTGDSERYVQNAEGILSATNHDMPDSTFSSDATEKLIIDQLKLYVSNSDTYSNWLRSVTNSEILRFIRARKGDINAAWQMIWDHSIWRQSFLGPDSFSPADYHAFERSLLNQELFWSGKAFDGSPVLYFKSGMHQSGATDVQFYTR